MIMGENFGDRHIILKGIGELYYAKGLPIGIAINKLASYGIEVSIYHVIDELYRNGFSLEKIESLLREECADSGIVGFEDIRKYIYSTYEEQRGMILQYLYGFSSNDRQPDNLKKLVPTIIQKLQ